MASSERLTTRFGHYLARLASGLATLLLAAYFFGFFLFTALLDRTPPQTLPSADGIVALTGGPDRITEAFKLLQHDKQGARLLITGVDPKVKEASLKRILHDQSGKFECCVDIGHQAEDTIGNATETAQWVRAHGYRSIILVTSTYHLPRARLELARAMPDVEIYPYPVFQASLHLDGWWAYPGTTRLLVAEYTKYLLTLAHARPLIDS
ncbi:MAG: YdcF family protein [Parvibaculum sp.]